ncbi:PREDICTED: laccase-like [Nicrophorus vespilloides]|uniref:Laccase-like n=1 Tax=Nicrophorus vespilloides TaxID=110193 RepID=A0ABM1M7Z9_NICVS|nr:PREDICTED: laccase-like [Nicrophorus vespilloides]
MKSFVCRLIIVFAFFGSLECLYRPDYKTHPCIRECNGTSMTCEYEFYFEWIFTNGVECGNCSTQQNMTDCQNPDCVVADGVQNLINVYNRMMPGPMIEVCHGDSIVVDFYNEINDDATSVHWHGMHQRNTNWMDGVGGVTQCPVTPNALFRYDFVADPAGTHFYHSHMGSQRVNGAIGPLIVKLPESDNPHADLYDFDLSEHVISVQDWYVYDANRIFYMEYRLGEIIDPSKVSAILVNKFGYNQANNNIPAARFNVVKGNRYRFRIINVGYRVCPIQVQIDKHNLTIISSDGFDLKPITVGSFVINVAERYDFVLNADQDEGGLYWMRFNGSIDCGGTEGAAVLSYAENPNIGDVTLPPITEQTDQIPILNCINDFPASPDCIEIPQTRSVDPPPERLTATAPFRYYLTFDVFNYALAEYGGPGFDPNKTTPTINNISLKLPSKALIETPNNFAFCNNENKTICPKNETICECVHVVKIPFNNTVEIILIDSDSSNYNLSHPIHLHGYGFRVLGQDSFDSISVESVKEMDSEGLLNRNFDNPPLKDVITIPAKGYIILRFISDNPGFWFVHCHVEHHLEAGMGLLLKVGDNFQALPENFPTCGDF